MILIPSNQKTLMIPAPAQIAKSSECKAEK
jgi:hypothetical protein